MDTEKPRPLVALFVTCLVDAIRPQIGFATIQLLEEAGCDVVVPEQQTCCGQPAFNSGDDFSATALARQLITNFELFDYIVIPSGSCTGMIHENFPRLFAADPPMLARARALAAKTFEILQFLRDIRGYVPIARRLDSTATYHDSCAGLRELAIAAQPRALLSAIAGLDLLPLEGSQECCGFGGTFCVKYPAISNAIVAEKAAAIERTGADLLLAGDLGCLMNMAGKLSRRGAATRCFHTVEILAGMGNLPAIGEAS
jgi:L-lactate dehydrogenase complex protein LldE